MAELLLIGLRNNHNDLVDVLEQNEHNVEYVSTLERALSQLELQKVVLEVSSLMSGVPVSSYDLLLCEMQLFYDHAGPKELVGYLETIGTKAIIIVKPGLATEIRSYIEKAGFQQIEFPYDAQEVLNTVNSLL